MSGVWLLERALVDDQVRDDVLVEVTNGRFDAVIPDATSSLDEIPHQATLLRGLTVPGLANCHSHAFHRAMRGRTQRPSESGPGSFWTWREQMYAVAARLDPDSYYALALATYEEMVAAGITCVGEFHYVHHQAGGTPYADANELGIVLIEAARTAGLRITLLDTCYLAAGFGQPPEGVQKRFSDGSAEAWAARVTELADRFDSDAAVRIAAAIHSVRAVPRHELDVVARWGPRRPLHVHLSEQTAENEAALAAHGLTPTQLLAEAGALGPNTSAVHATHLTDGDVALLGDHATYACFCPTTERDLGDGIGPSRALRQAGSPLTLGSDSHAVIDLFEEARAVEFDERLATQQRGHWGARELLDAATVSGHRSLGFDDAGRIAVGQRADLVTIDDHSIRTAGTGSDEHTAVFAATAADVTHVVTDGVVRSLDATRTGDRLSRAISAIWEDA